MKNIINKILMGIFLIFVILLFGSMFAYISMEIITQMSSIVVMYGVLNTILLTLGGTIIAFIYSIILGFAYLIVRRVARLKWLKIPE